MKKAVLFKKLKNNQVQCLACNHYCIISENNKGVCGVRKNIKGSLYLMIYGKPVSIALDPIEKKPLFHFLPRTKILSIGTIGCNFQCEFCFSPDTQIMTNKGILDLRSLYEMGTNEQQINNGFVKNLDNIKTITHLGYMQKIKHIFKHQYAGKMLTIKPHYTPEIKCTPIHPFYVYNINTKKITKNQAMQLKENDFLIIPKKIKIYDIIKQIDLKKLLKKYEFSFKKTRHKTGSIIKQLIEMKTIGYTSKEIGKRFNLHPAYVRTLFSKLKKNGMKKILFNDMIIIESNTKIRFKNERGYGIPKYIKNNLDLAKLLGLYCAEGTVMKCKNRLNSYRLVFSFGRHEEKLINETEHLIKKIFKLNPIITKRVTTTTVGLGKTSLALLFKELCGSSANSKKVPFNLFKSNYDCIIQFLRYYNLGDGWSKGGGNHPVSVNTTSKNLAFGIYALLLTLGYLPSYFKWKPPTKKKIEHRIINQSVLYYVKLYDKNQINRFLGNRKKSHIYRPNFIMQDKNYYFTPIHKLNSVYYQGEVYNMEIEKEHSYLTGFVSVGNCQNWRTSQERESYGNNNLTPKQIIDLALKNNAPSIAFTYNDPVIYIEYAYDIAKLAKRHKIKTVFVTNGYESKESIKYIARYLDAMNIDLKSFSNEFYQKVCKAKLQPVLETIKLAHKLKIWIEITTLIIPNKNDSESELKQIADFIVSVDKSIPWHITAFHPDYKMMDSHATKPESLLKAYKIGKSAGLKYVYTGNVSLTDYESTCCQKCNKEIIRRGFISAKDNKLIKGHCPYCKTKIPGIWK